MILVCTRCQRRLTIASDASRYEVRCPRCSTVLVAAEGEPDLEPDADPADPAPENTQAACDTDHPREGTDDYSFLTPPQRPGDLGCLGPYRILSVAGRGGMGVLFRAEDPVLGRMVALKVMLPELATNPTARQRFLREARAAAAVEHDHIVPVYQVAEVRGVPFIAMPLLRGESLEARLQRDRQLPLGEVLRIGREIAEGLAAAHAAGLIHRDIKPDNVWLEAHPLNLPRVRLLDFGLARPVEESARVTQDGAVVGTPAYMAPEQAESQTVDSRADLFSLGCILYRMAVGRRPFAGKTMLATLHAVLAHNPPPPHEVRSTIPRPLSELIMRLLEKDPARRSQSAMDVIEGLDRLLPTPPSGEPLHSRSASTVVAPVLPSARKQRWPIVAGVVLAAVVLGGLGIWVLLHGRGSSSIPPPEGLSLVSPSGDENRPKTATRITSYQLYYGNDPVLLERLGARVRAGQLIVIHARGLEKSVLADLLRRADRAGARVLAYLSIGELDEGSEEPFRRFLDSWPGEGGDKSRQGVKAIALRRNEKFNTLQVDVLNEAWRAYVLAEVNRLYAAGLHGVFLDTVDTVDLYIGNKAWPLPRRCRSVEAMLALLRAIKSRDRSKFIVQNRGLNLIGPTIFVGDEQGKEIPGMDFLRGHEDNPDALLWENAFATQDEWSAAKEKQLRAIGKEGRTAILALGYAATFRRREAFFRRCAEAGFVAAWATSSEKLHQELTIDPTVP